MQRSGKWQWLERALVITGTSAAVLYACLSVPAITTRVQAPPPIQTDEAVLPASVLGSAYLRGKGSTPDGTRIGTISIPQIRLSAPIVEGVGDADLRRGAGHVPGSAQSGGLGNMVLAAHRDTIFRSLRSIQKGMDISVTGPEGAFHYQVDSLRVVSPNELEVLEIASVPEVTLITCYPFNFIGSAPMRFIVKAHLVSPVPDRPSS